MKSIYPFPNRSPDTALVALQSVNDGTVRLRVEYWVKSGTGVAVAPRVVEALQQLFPQADVTVLPGG